MKNCLVTKYKSVVDNPYLSKMGEILISNPMSITNCVISTTDASGVITVEGGGHFEVGGNTTTSVPLNGTTFSYVAGNNSIVKIGNKYNLKYLKFSSLNLADLAFNEELTTLTASDGSIGDVSNIPSTVTRLNINGNSVSGNLSNMRVGKMVELHIIGNTSTDITCDNFAEFIKDRYTTSTTVIEFSHISKINSSLESIVSELVDAEFTSGDVRFMLYDCTGITFGGSSTFTNTYGVAYLKWNGKNTIIYQRGTDADVEDQSKKVNIWAKGADAAQITTWESQGNTVYVVE